MTPREGAFVGGLIGIATGGLAGLAGKRMIRAPQDIKALTFAGAAFLGTTTGAIIGAGTCPACACPAGTTPGAPLPTQPSPRTGAFIGGLLGLVGGGLLGLAGKQMIRGNKDIQTLAVVGASVLGSYTGAIIGAGDCQTCPSCIPPTTSATLPGTNTNAQPPISGQ